MFATGGRTTEIRSYPVAVRNSSITGSQDTYLVWRRETGCLVNEGTSGVWLTKRNESIAI